jgi:pimeloyl-ACP methyl ester carboxylesterase
MALALDTVRADGVQPSHWAVFLHGLLGRGSNWQGFARKLVAARPAWGAALLDLPLHGASQAFAPPHTLAHAASEVRSALAAVPGAARALIGHSFGGKVALLVCADPPPALQQVWVLDASPSARPARAEQDTTRRVLAALADLPPRFASRNDLVAELGRRGVDEALGRWLAKNLVREQAGLRLALDLAAIEELLADFDRTDLWALLEAPPAAIALRVVIGGRSDAVPQRDRERLRAAAARFAIELYELPEAGHWLHVDDPEGLLSLLVPQLR